MAKTMEDMRKENELRVAETMKRLKAEAEAEAEKKRIADALKPAPDKDVVEINERARLLKELAKRDVNDPEYSKVKEDLDAMRLKKAKKAYRIPEE